MKENEQASLSIKKIALITIALIFMLGVGVRATTANLNTVKIVLSDNYLICQIFSFSLFPLHF